ncbi:MAG: sugar phosphate isomerase/epimerase family protein [Cetobacterium sp.]|uniref:sugar phosphate isomerase/epimerase family protein n=1 Tax=Cetobacterium sp. ZOR0034 TaxID=1339239 RepID=UPI000645881B|nr:TIM barrel protein [Cetobacterium sp. ZOR0034]
MKISGFIDEIDIGFKKEVEIIKNLKMKFIELRSIDGKNISEMSLSEIDEIQKYLLEKNIEVSCIASPIGKINIENENFEEEFIEHFKKFKNVIEIAKRLKVKYVRVFSFFLNKENKKKYENIIFEKIESFLKEVDGTDLVLLHENEKGIYGDDIESCLNLIELTKKNSNRFKLIFDPANFVQVGVSPLKAYQKLKRYVEYVHLKDAKYSSNENVLIGTGDGQIFEILRELKNDSYENFLSLEPHLTNFSTLQSLEHESVKDRKVEFKDGKEAFETSLKTLLEMINRI